MSALRTTLLLLLIGTALQEAWGSTSQGVRELCRMRQGKMYHPYPGDESRYIQCNKVGRSFVRHCNSGQAWSQALLTCVTGSVTTNLEQPKETETYPAHDKRAMTSYVHRAPIETHAPARNRYSQVRYLISPLTYMYKLSAKPAYGYDVNSYSRVGVKSGDAKSTRLSYGSNLFSSRSRTLNPYKYYYMRPASRSGVNKRFMSTAYGIGVAGSSGTGTSRSYSQPRKGTSKGSFTSGTSYAFGSTRANANRAAQGKTPSVSYTFRSNKANTRNVYNRASLGKNVYSTAYGFPQGRTSSMSYGNSAQQNVYSGTVQKNAYNGAGQDTAYGRTSQNTADSGGQNMAYSGARQNNGYGGAVQDDAYGTSYAFGSKPSKTRESLLSGSSQRNAYSASYSGTGNTRGTAQLYGKSQAISYGGTQGNLRSTSYSFGSAPAIALRGSVQRSTYGKPYGNAQSNAHGAFQDGAHRTSYSGANTNVYGNPPQFGSAQALARGTAYNSYGPSHASPARNSDSTSYGSTQGSSAYSGAYKSYGTHHRVPNAYGQATSHHRYKGKSAKIHTPIRSPPAYILPTQQPQPTSTQCSDGTIRYLPDTTNKKHYFECITQYKMVNRTCDRTSVWVHPLRMCVDVNDKVSTNVPTTNPCAGTDMQYKAYPMDPTKYIECRAWYSVFVWTCREHQIWVEEQQKCIDTKVLQPAAPVSTHHVHHHQHKHQRAKPKAPPGPQPTRSRPEVNTASPCDNITFHFTFPGDDTKFIQCDQFGRTFTRPCASSSKWNDDIKTCAKNLGLQPRTIPAVPVNSNSYDYDFINAQPLSMKEYEAGGFDAEGSHGGGSHYAGVRGDAKTYTYNNVESSYTSTEKDPKQCDNGDLWVPSLRICVPMKDAERGSDYCHSGDYYFRKHDVCASIRYSNIQGKSFPSKDTYYTNYDSYVSNNDKSTQNSGGPETTVAFTNHCAADHPVYDGENPCGVNDTYYYVFKNDSNCFIQCDQLNTMYIMSCAPGSAWNPNAIHCIKNNEGDYDFTDLDTTRDYQSNDDGSSSLAARSSKMGAHFSADYPQDEAQSVCDGTSGALYEHHPGNPHRFVMCINNVAYPMWCPRTKLWQQNIKTCVWPKNQQ